MKRIYSILICTCFFLTCRSFSQSLNWAVNMGGTGDDSPLDLVVDGMGNVFTTGYFEGTADFDPGPGAYLMTAAGSRDIFVSKLDSSGNFLWAIRWGATDFNYGRGLAVDAGGNVYITGLFYGTVDFDPGPGIYNLSTAGGQGFGDAFVTKLDPGGNFIWAKQFGGNSEDDGKFISVDDAGNVLVGGEFSGTADLDPGPAVLSFTSAANSDIFISKMDNTGNLIWAKQIEGNNIINGDRIYGIATDEDLNIYSTGNFYGTADFDPGPGSFTLSTSGTNADVFVLKLNAAGDFVWARKLGGSGYDSGNAISVVSGMPASGVYVSGGFAGIADFDPGTGTYYLTSSGSVDGFLCKLDTAGMFRWAHALGGSGYEFCRSVAVDTGGLTHGIYATGYFISTVDFDPDTGSFILTPAGADDAFIWKLDFAGSFISACQMGGTMNDAGYAIRTNHAGSIYVAGSFTAAADMDPGSGTSYLVSFGGFDSFILKASVTTLTAIASPDFPKDIAVVYPNPSTGEFKISANDVIREIIITDQGGKLAYHSRAQASECSIRFDTPGIYCIQLTLDKTVVRKLLTIVN